MKTKGWKNIFKFTFVQTIKAKSFKISTVIICVIFALILVCVHIIPALVMSGGNDDAGGEGEISAEDITGAIYLMNDTGIEPDLSDLPGKWEIIKTNGDEFSAACEQISTSDKAELAVDIHMTPDIFQYSVNMYRPQSEETITAEVCEEINSVIYDKFCEAKLFAAGVSDQESILLAESPVSKNLVTAGEDVTDPLIQVFKGIIPVFTAIVMFMLTIVYGQNIATSIAQEKSSRVVEILLTSVDPLAVIIGKILSMACVALFQVLIVGIVTAIVNMICMPFSFVTKMAEGAISFNAEADMVIDFTTDTLANAFNPLNIVFIVLVFLLGFLFYALIFGLTGASVSRIEDLSNAMQPTAFVSVIGFMLAYIPGLMQMEGDDVMPDGIIIAARYLPISSPFSLPSAILLGEISAGEAVISILFLALCSAVFAVFVSKVYKHMILHSGNPLKLKDMFRLAKEK